jgi:hypothetical protein
MSKIDINQLTETTKMLDICVHVIGIKKRCRSIDRHSLELGKYTTDTTLESLIDEAKTLVHSSMKSVQGDKCTISAMNLEIEIQGHMLITKFNSQDVFGKKKLEVML